MFGSRVSTTSSDSLIGSLGVAADGDREWKDDDGEIRRSHLYGIANLYHDFTGATDVNVADVFFRSEPTGCGVG